MDDERRGQLVAGLTLVVVGGLLAARQLLHWRPLAFGTLWPIIVIAMGGHKVWRGLERRDGTAGWGVSFMLIGTVLLLHTQHVLPLSRSWPLVVVAHGIGMLLGSSRWARQSTRVDQPAGEVRHDR
jgi:hypothetical protein